MNKSGTRFLFTFLLLLFTGSGLTSLSANATDASQSPYEGAQKIFVALPPVMLRGNTHSGQILLRQVWPLNRTEYDKIHYLSGEITAPALRPEAGPVHATNIPGIGIRFYHEAAGNGRMDYPFTLAHENVMPDNLVMELVQTAEETGTGYLSPGTYATLYVGENRRRNKLLEVIVPAKSVSVVSSSCEVDSGSRNILFKLPEVNISDFHGIGSVAGEQQNIIKIVCSGGASLDLPPDNLLMGKVKINFSYQPVQGNIPGVIATLHRGNAAKGIGIQIRLGDTHAPLIADRPVILGTPHSGMRDVINVPVSARYYQIDSAVHPGTVTAMAYFNIIYN